MLPADSQDEISLLIVSLQAFKHTIQLSRSIIISLLLTSTKATE